MSFSPSPTSETSTSKDARKMYGDTTPGDITHQDVTLEYSGFFKNAFRSLPKGLKEDMDKYRIWEMCADIMKVEEEEKEEKREEGGERMEGIIKCTTKFHHPLKVMCI